MTYGSGNGQRDVMVRWHDDGWLAGWLLAPALPSTCRRHGAEQTNASVHGGCRKSGAECYCVVR
jgi:hypothetical protein